MNKLVSIKNDRDQVMQRDLEKLKKKEKELVFWQNELSKNNPY